MGSVWFLWKETNTMILEREETCQKDVVELIKARIAHWASIKDEFRHYSALGIMRNWGAAIGGGSKRRRVFLSGPLLLFFCSNWWEGI